MCTTPFRVSLFNSNYVFLGPRDRIVFTTDKPLKAMVTFASDLELIQNGQLI